MATVATTVANRIELVRWPAVPDDKTLICAADLVAGTFVREDANGKWVQALATSAPNALGARLLLRTCKTGEGGTAIRRGTVAGYTVTQAYGASLFLSDTGTLADAAGTVSVQVGRVTEGMASDRTSAVDKLVDIDCPL